MAIGRALGVVLGRWQGSLNVIGKPKGVVVRWVVRGPEGRKNVEKSKIFDFPPKSYFGQKWPENIVGSEILAIGSILGAALGRL